MTYGYEIKADVFQFYSFQLKLFKYQLVKSIKISVYKGE